ncbi:MAG: hypothetical protein ACI81L_002460 [Verrucomicrobiales bacterium]|jgi:hypothetical protein
MLAVVWTWWIALILVPATIGLLVMIVGGYLFSVTRQQYPSRKQRKLQ